jgi:hypothetical protein
MVSGSDRATITSPGALEGLRLSNERTEHALSRTLVQTQQTQQDK